jgi:bifunctional DNA-binding transcriptional regulator/antitoxin component of YhaV-PrlF toxin-antitoxin module
MTGTITIDDSGQILLPEVMRREFGVTPGVRLRAEVSPDRIEIVRDEVPLVTGAVEEDGLLLLPSLGIRLSAAAAVRGERDALADRALRR